MESKISIFKSVGLMWKKAFDYKSVASRREYWLVVLFDAILTAVFFGLAFFSFAHEGEVIGNICLIVCWLIILYLVISIVPGISLTVRRLHDVGKSGWWTFLLLAVGIGTVFLMIMCATVSPDSSRYWNRGFKPSENTTPDVYGPPEWWSGTGYIPEENEEAGVYGSPNFDDNGEYDPATEVPEDVYGPPAWFDGEEEN